MNKYTPRCAGIVARCSLCQKVVQMGQGTTFQKWADGKLQQVFKCHSCVVTEQEGG